MKNETSREKIIELLKRAREDSNQSFEALKRLYQPLIEAETRRHILSNMSSQDISDMREEAIIAFCNAICSYDIEEENVEFGLYAKICISNAMVSFVRSYNRRIGKKILPFDDGTGDNIAVHYDPMQRLIEEEAFLRLRRRIQSNLSKYESRVWWMYVSGMDAATIAKQLGKGDTRSVSNAIYRIRRKLRKLLSDYQ